MAGKLEETKLVNRQYTGLALVRLGPFSLKARGSGMMGVERLLNSTLEAAH